MRNFFAIIIVVAAVAMAFFVVPAGNGYAENEELTIKMIDPANIYGANVIDAWTVTADANGRFSLPLFVPYVKPIRAAINVDGDTSLRHYQIGFEVK